MKHPVLAVGAEWKNCFCLASGGRAYVSPHIGSVATAQGEEFWLETLSRCEGWTGIKPAAIACDLHPDYSSTRLAERLAADRSLPLVRVQHHYAHILSVLAEAGLDAPVLGIACDGTGFGTDGTAWGCEFLLVGPDRDWTRVGSLLPMRLAGAGAEMADPVRTGRAYLAQSVTGRRRRVGSLGVYPGHTRCSSLGRLFDAVAGITAICRHATFDAEAAIAIESCADPAERGSYLAGDVVDFTVSPAVFDPRSVLRRVSRETKAGVQAATIAARFQNTVVQAVGQVALELCRRHQAGVVALSGGSFQNRRLVTGVGDLLRRRGVVVVTNQVVPANDGGIALGQIAATAR